MVGQVVRSFGEYRYLKDIYEKKTYGKLKSIVMQRISGDTKWGYEDWFHEERKSGSVVLDLHIHDLDFLRYMLGEPDSFTVKAAAFPGGMINQIITSYQFGSVFATAEGIWDVCTELPFEGSFRACFEEATIIYQGRLTPTVQVYHKGGEISVPVLQEEISLHDETAGINISDLGPYYTEIKYFYECLADEREITRAPLEEGIKSVLLGIEEWGSGKEIYKGIWTIKGDFQLHGPKQREDAQMGANMRVGILVNLHADMDLKEKFGELKEMGVESCQLVCWDRSLLNEETAAVVREAVREKGIEITAFWCGWEGPKVWNFYEGQETLGLVPQAFRFRRLEMLLEGSDFARLLGVDNLVTHVGYMPENPYDPNYHSVIACLKELALRCKNNGQNFLFETGQETPVTLKRAIQDIGTGNVGINLDPANLLMYGKAIRWIPWMCLGNM